MGIKLRHEQKIELIGKIRKARRIILAIQANTDLLGDGYEIDHFLYSIGLVRMWMGKLLGYLGERNPYGHMDGNRKTVADVVPIADDFTSADIPACIRIADKISYVQLLDKLRIEISKMETVVGPHNYKAEYFINENQSFYAMRTIERIWQLLEESRMWLGAEMHRVADKNTEV